MISYIPFTVLYTVSFRASEFPSYFCSCLFKSKPEEQNAVFSSSPGLPLYGRLTFGDERLLAVRDTYEHKGRLRRMMSRDQKFPLLQQSHLYRNT